MIRDSIWAVRQIKQKIEIKLFDLGCWWAYQKLNLACKLWNLRGLKTCEEHGFHAQSWITGKCRKCKK